MMEWMAPEEQRENQVPENTSPMHSDVPRLERIRRRRRMRRMRVAVVCVVLLAGMMAYFAGLYGASLALLGDMFDTVTIALTPGPGYPISFSMPGFTQAQVLAGGFVAVGEKDAAIYAANGNEVRRIQHGYARPCITAGNTRVCIYNRAGTELRVESRSQTLFENKFEQPIELCEMSPNGTLAVFTKGELIVYDPMFEDIFHFHTGDLPTAMAFASDNRRFAVGCPYAEGGALGGTVYLLDARADEAVAVIRNTEGIPLQIQYISRTELLVIYDTFAALYNTQDGTQIARYDYGGQTLQSAAVSAGKNAVLLFGGDTYTAQTSLVVLDAALQPVGTAQVGARTVCVAAGRTGAYVLTSSGVRSYSLEGEYLGETVADAKPLALLEAGRLLLITETSVSEFTPPQPDAGA